MLSASQGVEILRRGGGGGVRGLFRRWLEIPKKIWVVVSISFIFTPICGNDPI